MSSTSTPPREPSRDEEQGQGERAPLLAQRDLGDGHEPSRRRVSNSVARKLYLSHTLSTWNSRVFEFGAVLYLAAIFPGTLVPMSVYALVRGFSAIALAPAVGMYIDKGNRLHVVRVSIVFQRLAVAASCVVFYTLTVGIGERPGYKEGMLALVSFFACVEKLCSIMNLVSVEKDWVVVVAERDPEALRVINSQMRRIDLFCKLLGPLFIALIDGYSTRLAVAVNFGMNVASVVVEYFAIARVYHEVPELQLKKASQASSHQGELPERGRERTKSALIHAFGFAAKFAHDFATYFRHRAFLPSFAGAALYLTVLSFAGQMVTYLLFAGYSSTQVGIARTFGVVFELMATWAVPWLMQRIGTVRTGLWMSSWQVAMLATGITVFWVFEDRPLLSASGLVVGTILSRFGLWGFDLCVQLIVQEEVEADNRGAFSSVEAAWQNGFELLAFATTIVFSRPAQFKWPSLISVVAVMSAYVAYLTYVYKTRGHILHLEKLSPCSGSMRVRLHTRERALRRITSRPDI